MKCPRCGESMLRECVWCGWRKPPRSLDAIADVVLRYRPKPKSEPAKQRRKKKRRIDRKGDE